MKLTAFILNLPWTLIGLIASHFSIPKKIDLSKNHFAFVIHIRSFWWYSLLTGQKRIRGMAMGNIILLAPLADDLDLKHELIHVEQFEREPFIHFFLNWYQLVRFGYRGNKYEKEAYRRSGSRFYGKDENLTRF